jgi:hypothetical protein
MLLVMLIATATVGVGAASYNKKAEAIVALAMLDLRTRVFSFYKRKYIIK